MPFVWMFVRRCMEQRLNKQTHQQQIFASGQLGDCLKARYKHCQHQQIDGHRTHVWVMTCLRTSSVSDNTH